MVWPDPSLPRQKTVPSWTKQADGFDDSASAPRAGVELGDGSQRVEVVHRLLGLENRLLDKRDFANDKVDAGGLGSGQSACGG